MGKIYSGVYELLLVIRTFDCNFEFDLILKIKLRLIGNYFLIIVLPMETSIKVIIFNTIISKIHYKALFTKYLINKHFNFPHSTCLKNCNLTKTHSLHFYRQFSFCLDPIRAVVFIEHVQLSLFTKLSSINDAFLLPKHYVLFNFTPFNSYLANEARKF